MIRRRGTSRSDQVYRFSKAPSLGLLGPLSPVRRFAISVVTNRYPLGAENKCIPDQGSNRTFASVKPKSTIQSWSETKFAIVSHKGTSTPAKNNLKRPEIEWFLQPKFFPEIANWCPSEITRIINFHFNTTMSKKRFKNILGELTALPLKCKINRI